MFCRENKTGKHVEIREGIGAHLVVRREPYLITDAELAEHFTRLDDRRANALPRRQRHRFVDPVSGGQRRQHVGRRRRDSVTTREDFWLASEGRSLPRNGTVRHHGRQQSLQSGRSRM